MGLNVGLLLHCKFLAIFACSESLMSALFSSTAEQAELVYSYRIHFDKPLSQLLALILTPLILIFINEAINPVFGHLRGLPAAADRVTGLQRLSAGPRACPPSKTCMTIVSRRWETRPADQSDKTSRPDSSVSDPWTGASRSSSSN
uniref:Anoctamin n=1 Tax=Macrostomum lignano TaxID=282301 RepID=A0A1I8F6L1_9PLAT